MSFNSVLALELGQLLLPGACISLYTLSENSHKDKCCHCWAFPGRIRLASGYHKVLLTANKAGAEGSHLREPQGEWGGTSGCWEAVSREWMLLCNSWSSVQNQTTLNALWFMLSHPGAHRITGAWNTLPPRSQWRFSPLGLWKGVRMLPCLPVLLCGSCNGSAPGREALEATEAISPG